MAIPRRPTPPPASGFAMAPMIDMVFLLLVFFMTVSRLAQADRGTEVTLPESHQSAVPDDLSDRRYLTVQADGTLFFGTTEIPTAELLPRLREALSRQPNLTIQVRADAATRYAAIQSILQTCAEAGIQNVIYATHQLP